MKISIVIPNFNGEENLKNNLPKVIAALKKNSENTEIIIVDDASNDDSIGYLKSVCSDSVVSCRYIVNKKNLGFAESCNIGVKNAKGEIVVLLNTDVFPEENFLEFLIPHFDDEKVFAVGCLEKTIDEKDNITGVRGVGKLFFKDGIFQHMAGDLNSRMTDWVCGGSGAFRKDIFMHFGGFDKNFAPFYWEDVDLSYRAKKADYKLLFEKKSIIYHKHIEGSIAKKYSASEINEISFKNQIKFTKKHIKNFDQKFKFFIFRLKHRLI